MTAKNNRIEVDLNALQMQRLVWLGEIKPDEDQGFIISHLIQQAAEDHHFLPIVHSYLRSADLSERKIRFDDAESEGKQMTIHNNENSKVNARPAVAAAGLEPANLFTIYMKKGSSL